MTSIYLQYPILKITKFQIIKAYYSPNSFKTQRQLQKNCKYQINKNLKIKKRILHLKNQESNTNNFQIRNFNPSSKLIINTFNTEYEVVKQAAKNIGFKVRQIEPMFYNPAPSNFNY